jgi:hypothetical protein
VRFKGEELNESRKGRKNGRKKKNGKKERKIKEVLRRWSELVEYSGGWPARDSLYDTSNRSLSPLEACNQQPA